VSRRKQKRRRVIGATRRRLVPPEIADMSRWNEDALDRIATLNRDSFEWRARYMQANRRLFRCEVNMRLLKGESREWDDALHGSRDAVAELTALAIAYEGWPAVSRKCQAALSAEIAKDAPVGEGEERA
jgi:hypothetical protein